MHTLKGYLKSVCLVAVALIFSGFVILEGVAPVLGVLPSVILLLIICAALFLIIFTKMEKDHLNYTAMLFAAVGLVVSIYLTIIHYFPSVPLVCSTTGVINCNNVLNSQYAVVFGVPLAVMGIVFFVLEFAVLLLIKENDYFLALSGIGLAVVAYGIFSEYAVSSICEYCTAVHICTLALFIIAMLREKK